MFGRKKETANLTQQPLNYWEEKSYMMAIVEDENEDVLEGAFERVAKIDGVQIVAKGMPGEQNPGKIILTYDGEEYEVCFYDGGFSLPPVLRDIERQQYFFTEEELKRISEAHRAITIFMEFHKDSKKSFHLQLKIAIAMVPGMIGLMDESAEKLINANWVRMAASSKVTPAAGDLYLVQAVQGEKNDVWLHTHGLCRCGLTELEIVGSNQENSNNHYHVITTLASMLLDKDGKEEKPYRYIGDLQANNPLVVTYIPWIEGLKEYDKISVGDAKDRAEGHNTKTSLIFSYRTPDDVERRVLTKISDLDNEWGDNPLLFISNEETDRMRALAMERFYLVKEMAKNRENKIIIKVGLTVDEEYRTDDNFKEHIWFEVNSVDGDKFKATLLQEPYYISNMHEGYEGEYTVDDVTDWRINAGDRVAGPDTAYVLMYY